MEFFTDIGGFILKPLYFLVSAIMLGWHQIWGAIFGPASGASWALSIIGLTVTIRALMIPLFVKQIKSSRNMQLLQPRVKELQKKYGHDRERLAQETMALYRETKTNPFASCLPLIIQMPFFLALFRMIDQAAKNGEGRGLLTDTQAQQLRDAEIFGVKISASFTSADGDVRVQIFAAILVVAMTLTTFLTQRQLMSKNMPADALTGPVRPAAEAAPLRAPPRLRRRRHRLPDRRAPVLDHLQPLDDGPTVLRDPQQPGAQHRGRPGQGSARRGEAQAQGPARGRLGHGRDRPTRVEPEKPAPRQQPKKQSRSQRKKGGGGGGNKPPASGPKNE